MSNSKLINIKIPASEKNYISKRENKKIKKITIYNMEKAISLKDYGKQLQNPSKKASCHYAVDQNGKIGQYIDEKDTALGSDKNSNLLSVAIKISSQSTKNLKIGRKPLKSLTKLVADISYRNNLGPLIKGKNIIWHKSKPYQKNKIDHVIKKANKINKKQTKIKYLPGAYKCLYDLTIRAGSGKTYKIKKVNEITKNDQKRVVHKEENSKAIYKKGTIFTALKILKSKDKSIWAKTPSGYVCIKDIKNIYCQKYN